MPLGSYERATQLGPAAAVLAPASVLAILMFTAGDLVSTVRTVFSIVGVAGFHLIFLRLVRDRGNAIQADLWASWGGSTTIQRLRWTSGETRKVARLHRRIQNMTGVVMPSESEELADPAAADDVYDDGVARLREMTRDHDRYPRVWSELMQYGTARNLYACKRLALWVAGVVVVVSMCLSVGCAMGLVNVSWVRPASAGVLAAAAMLVWRRFVNPAYVRRASERYSDALLAVPGEPGTGS